MKQFLTLLCTILVCSSIAQQTEYVDFTKAEVELTSFNLSEKWVRGHVNYSFDVLKPVDSLYLDSKNIYDYIVFLNDEEVTYYVEDDKLWIIHDFEASTNNVLSIAFNAMTKKAIYFVERQNDTQIWTQGQGKYTSNWLPSIDDMNEKIEFDLTIAFDKDYEVIANGKLVKKGEGEVVTRWHYDMKHPMPSYLVALVIGKYNKVETFSDSDIPLEMYYYPGDEDRVEPTYRYTKRMFDFLENEIGVAYPWQNYKQIPVHDFLYAGMENTGTTIFSDDFVVDDKAFEDRNYVNVNAHELAHQWFGNLVTAKSGTHHWLQEGFASYYALLAERDIFGDNYFYWRLYESAQQLVQQDLSGKGTSLLNPKSSSLTFYQKGAWTLYMLREKIGSVAFRSVVQQYLNSFQFKNAETLDFIGIAAQVSEQDLSGFYEVWFEDESFPIDRAMDALKQNSMFIQEYLMVDCEVKTSKCKEYLVSGISDEAKVKLIAQNPSLITKEVFKNGPKVRQAIAQYLVEIPKSLKSEYESLLEDKSYATIESALYNLWINFPEERSKYLHSTKDVIGFNDYNVRMLWLALHLNTVEYQSSSKQLILKELIGYTSNSYNAQVRIAAFSYLNMMKACNEACEKNLNEAKTHHNWQLSKFAKNLQAKQ